MEFNLRRLLTSSNITSEQLQTGRPLTVVDEWGVLWRHPGLISVKRILAGEGNDVQAALLETEQRLDIPPSDLAICEPGLKILDLNSGTQWLNFLVKLRCLPIVIGKYYWQIESCEGANSNPRQHKSDLVLPRSVIVIDSIDEWRSLR